MDLAEKILRRREELGLSQAQLAERAGTNQQTIDRIEGGSNSRAIPRVLEVLQLGPDATAAVTRIVPKPVPIPGERTPRQLPIYASAMGGPGEIIINYEPIDYVARPDPLASVRDGYGMYIVGDSMSPAFEQGDLALVNPHLPFQRGNDVLVFREMNGDVAAIIKRLVDASRDQWTLQQFNPPKEIKVDREEWPRCHVIIGKYSRR